MAQAATWPFLSAEAQTSVKRPAWGVAMDPAMLMNSILYASSSQGLKNAVMAQMAVALVASTVLPDVTGVRPPPRPPRAPAT